MERKVIRVNELGKKDVQYRLDKQALADTREWVSYGKTGLSSKLDELLNEIQDTPEYAVESVVNKLSDIGDAYFKLKQEITSLNDMVRKLKK